MDLGISGKKALVTGAGRGIGKSIALCLAREGVIIAAVSRSANDMSGLMEELSKYGTGHVGIAKDLMPDKAPDELFNKLTCSDFGEIDIVIHNLGGTLDIKNPFCSIEDWRRIFRFNLEIAVQINNLITPEMIKNKWGRIVHVSSIASMENQGPVTYCAIKAALTAYTRSLGGVLAPEGIVVSAILPGAVFTQNGYWDTTLRENPEHVRKFLSERQRIGRFGRTEEIGNYVAFLCSELASFNTGSIVPIDGSQGRGYFGQ